MADVMASTSSADQQQQDNKHESSSSSTVLTKVCKGSAIKGSSLLSTNEDIRGLLKSNQPIYINDVQYLTHMTKNPSSWPVCCVELNSDFNQDTSIEAVVRFDWTKPASKKKKATTQAMTTEAQLGNIQTMLNVAMNEVKALVPVAYSSSKNAGSVAKTRKKAMKEGQQSHAETTVATTTTTTDDCDITNHNKPAKQLHSKQDAITEDDEASARAPRRLPPLARPQPKAKPKPKPQEALEAQVEVPLDNNPANSNAITIAQPSSSSPSSPDDKKQPLPPAAHHKQKPPEGVHIAAQRIKARIQAAALAAEQKATSEQEKRLEIEQRNDEQRKLLQERTLQRIEQRRIAALKAEEEHRLRLAAQIEQKQLSARWTQSKEHRDRMEAVAKAAAERLRNVEEREAQKQRREDYELKVALRRIKQNYDVSTTYALPRPIVDSVVNKRDIAGFNAGFNNDFTGSEVHVQQQLRQSRSQPATATKESSSSSAALLLATFNSPPNYHNSYSNDDDHDDTAHYSPNPKESLHNHHPPPPQPLNPVQIERRRIELEGKVQRWLEGTTDSEAELRFTAELKQQQRQRQRTKSNSSSEFEGDNNRDGDLDSSPRRAGNAVEDDGMQDSLSISLGRDEDDDNGGMGLYKPNNSGIGGCQQLQRRSSSQAVNTATGKSSRRGLRDEDDLSDLSSDEEGRRRAASRQQPAASSSKKTLPNNTASSSSALKKSDSALPPILQKTSSTSQERHPQPVAVHQHSAKDSPRSSGQTSTGTNKKPRRRKPMPVPLPIAPFQEVAKPVLFLSSLR